MKYIFSLFCSILFGAISYSQTTPVQLWQKVEFIERINLKPPTIALDNFGNTYMLTNQTNTSPFGGTRLVKYDTLGNVLWQRNSPVGIIGIFYGSFTLDSIGNAYLGFGYDGGLPNYDADAVLVKYSPDGDVLWSSNYGINQAGDSYIYFSDMDTINGRLITLGMNLHDTILDENFLFVQAVDTSNGGVIWKTKIEGEFRPQNIRVRADHIQLLSTRYKPDSRYFVNTRVGFDGTLLEQYEKPYSGNYAIDFNCISKNGDVVFGNRADGYSVTRVNFEGDTLWRHAYPYVVLENWVRCVQEDNSLNIYATGSSPSADDNFDFTTTKISLEGEILWEKREKIQDQIFETGNKVFVSDSLIFVAGAFKPTSDSAKILIKVYDALGDERNTIVMGNKRVNSSEDIIYRDDKIYFTGYQRQSGNTTVEIVTGVFLLPKISVSDEPERPSEMIAVYPNPAQDYIRVTNIDLKVFDQVCIFDTNGKMINKRKINNREEVVPIHSIPPGNYTVSLIGKDVILSKKIVKM
jgi:hypothetical protein